MSKNTNGKKEFSKQGLSEEVHGLEALHHKVLPQEHLSMSDFHNFAHGW